MSHDLTLPGTIPGLLRRCSPVAIMRDGGKVSAFGVVVDQPSDRVTWVRVLRDHDDEGPSPWDRDCVALDLTDATGRAHAAWWLAGTFAGEMERQSALSVWRHREGAGRAWRLEGAAGSERRFLARYTGCSFDVVVLTLSDLDPNDDTRLPDGSRRVDAEALRRVVLHVAGVTHG